jgi:hypothetical protein
MKKKSIERAVRQLRAVESRRAALVDELAQTDAVIVGSLSKVRRRCGKPGCHCAKGAGHVQVILMSVRGGRRRCQLIRRADHETVGRAVERYRAFRQGIRLLNTLDSRALALLRELMRSRDKDYE